MLKPLVGESGKYFNTCLGMAGVQRAALRLSNLFKYRIPNDAVESFVDTKRGFQSQEYLTAVEELRIELQQCSTKVFLALGDTAMYALTGKVGITKWRGSPLPCVLDPNKIIVPTFHPSPKNMNRDYFIRYLICADIMKAHGLALGTLRIPKRNFITLPSFEDAMSYIDKCTEAAKLGSMVSVDIEFTGSIDAISFSYDPNEAMSIGFSCDSGDVFSVEQETALWKRIGVMLEDPNVPKVGQNFAYDFEKIFEALGIVVKNIHDTMIMHMVMKPDLKKSLALMTSMYTCEPFYKEDLKRHREIPNYQSYWRYNAMDAAVTLEIANVLKAELLHDGMWQTYESQRALIEPLVFQKVRGMKIDHNRFVSDGHAVRMRLRDQEAEFAKVTGGVNPKSNQQMTKLLYEDLGEKPIKSKKGEGLTADKFALAKIIARSKGPSATVAKMANDIRATKKMLEYYETNLSADGRLRAILNAAGSEYGRLSSEKDKESGEGRNQQNLPKYIRRCIVPDDGCVFAECDYSQAELRVMAYCAGVMSMQHAFETGMDVHLLTACRVTGRTPEDLKADPDYESIRRKKGKDPNFGLNYRMQAAEYARRYGVPLSEAMEVISTYFSVYPEIRRYQDKVENDLKMTRTLENPFGRKRVYLGRMDDTLVNEGCDFKPQSTVADAMNKWGIVPLYRDCPDLVFMNTVHDSLWLQFDMRRMTEAAKQMIFLTNSMQQKILDQRGGFFRIPIDWKLGFNVADKFEFRVTDDVDETVTSMRRAIEEARNHKYAK